MERITIDNNVKDLLKKHQCKRSSQKTSMKNSTTKEFIFSYWKKYDGLKSRFDMRVVRKLTDPESITRSSRKSGSTNPKLLPTSLRLIKARRSKEREMKKHYS